jgi:hypothetical protein
MQPEPHVSPLPARLAYLVRLWPVETEHGLVWRATAQDPYSAEHHSFADLQALFKFLTQKTQASGQDAVQPPD